MWEDIRHFDRALKWVPRGEGSTITVRGTGVGAVRDIHLATQGYVQHRLIAFDDGQRTFSCELTTGRPIGMQDYTVVATVTGIPSTSAFAGYPVGRQTRDEY